MDVEEEGPGIETILIFVAEEVDVREVGGWEEGFERYRGVEKDQVGVDPPAMFC